jgi:hypothetical protein
MIQHISNLDFTIELASHTIVDLHMILKLVKDLSVLGVKRVNQILERLSFFFQPINSFLRVCVKHLEVVALLLQMALLST